MLESAIAVRSKILPKISVIIVTYRSTRELPGCIDSVLRQRVPVEIFVVDNASPDHTPEMIAGYGERHDNVYPILNTENLGLAAGNNCPIGKCQGEYVLILNPDTVLPDMDTPRVPWSATLSVGSELAAPEAAGVINAAVPARSAAAPARRQATRVSSLNRLNIE